MSVREIFKTLVEPSLERIAVLEVSHVERLQEQDYVVTQVVQRNVFTELDRKLSRHLAATRGAGFPAYTVAVRVNETGAADALQLLTPVHYESVPHALKGIVDRAFANTGEADLTVFNNDPAGGGRGHGVRRNVSADDIEALNAALQICDYLGEPEFLSISGDYDIVIVAPPGDQLPITMYLKNGNVSVPCSNGTTITPFECPLHGFGVHVAENVLAQGYVAQVRHALIATKVAAVMEFRAMAEARLVNFERALAGRPLEGARQEIASALIARLMAGMGPSLSGLSEDAQLAALDWSAAIDPKIGGLAPAGYLDLENPKQAKA